MAPKAPPPEIFIARVDLTPTDYSSESLPTCTSWAGFSWNSCSWFSVDWDNLSLDFLPFYPFTTDSPASLDYQQNGFVFRLFAKLRDWFLAWFGWFWP